MKIIKFKNGYENQVSNTIKDALLNHKFDFKNTERELIEHDIAIYNPLYIKKLAQKAELFLYVSDDEQKVYAVACLDKDELHSCYTKGEKQGSGLGTSLIKHAEKIAKLKNIKKLRVYANFYAEPFYRSCGFRLIKHTTVNFQGKTWPVVYMKKKL